MAKDRPKRKESKKKITCCGCTSNRSSDNACEDPMLSDQQQYRYMTVDDMKSMGDDSMRVNVTDDERDNRHSGAPTITEMITKEHYQRTNAANLKPDNVDINRHPVHVGFLVSFLVDARGGAMRGCRHSGVRVIVPPRKAAMPMRVTCRYLRRDKLTNPPPLMEGEALASRILELGPVGAKFLGPVIIEVPHFASLRGKEREIVILRSDNGETWREHTLEASEEAVQDVLNESFEGEELSQLEDLQTSRIVRILTADFPHYFAVVSRIRQEVHAVGPEGGTVSSSAVPQVQAVFPPAALTKKIRVGLQAHPIPADLVAKLLGNRVAVSPIVTVEPRRRKFHKPITLTIPVPQAANKGMINQYSGDAPTLRILCSITGGQSRAVWEDVTGSTPLTFVKDCVSFSTTVSARFWLMDCRNISEATKMATELYTHATHVPFMAKFVVFAKRVDPLEARLRVFCMTDDKEDKTLEHQEHFTEVAKSRDVEVLEGKTQYMEFSGNLVPVLKSGEQLQLPFRAFKENRVPFTARVKDPDAADMMGRIMFMSEPKVPKGELPQTPICTLNILLPEKISSEPAASEMDLLELSKNYSFLRDGGISRPDAIHRATIRLTDIANLLDNDWEKLAEELNIPPNEVSTIKEEYANKPAQQAAAMLKVWHGNGNKATGNTLEKALNKIGREDIVKKCIFNVELVTDDVEKAVARVRLDQPGFDSLKEELGPSRDTSLRRDAKMDPNMDPDYDEYNKSKETGSIEDLNISSTKQDTPKQHVTITNGTVFNGTSTPIKDKYASEEKELRDVMADFLEHKCQVADTMSKKSRDELDDKDKKRQRVIADANKIVSGVIADAEKEKGKLAKEGWSVVYDDDDDARDNREARGVVVQTFAREQLTDKLPKDKGVKSDTVVSDREPVVEPTIVKQRFVRDGKGDSNVTIVASKTIVSMTDDKAQPVITQTITVKEVDSTVPPQTITISNGKESIVSKKEMLSKEGKDVDEKLTSPTSAKAKKEIGKQDVSPQKEAKTKETKPTDKQLSAYESVYSVQYPSEDEKQEDESKKSKDKSGILSGIFKGSKLKKSKSKGSKDMSVDSGDEEAKVAAPVEHRTQTVHITFDSQPDSKPADDIKLATMQFLDDSRRIASTVHVPDGAVTTTRVEESKTISKEPDDRTATMGSDASDQEKEKGSGFFGIFKSPKSKEKKMKKGKEASFDSGDEELRIATEKLLDDTRKVAETTIVPSAPKIEGKQEIHTFTSHVRYEEDIPKDKINGHSYDITEIQKKSETDKSSPHKEANGKSDAKKQKERSLERRADSPDKRAESEKEDEESKEKGGFFSMFKSPKLKTKKRSSSREKSSSKETSFDSGDEETRHLTADFLQDTKKVADTLHHEEAPKQIVEKTVPETVSEEPVDKDKGIGIFSKFRSPKLSRESRSRSREKSVPTQEPVISSDSSIREATVKFLEDTRNLASATLEDTAKQADKATTEIKDTDAAKMKIDEVEDNLEAAKDKAAKEAKKAKEKTGGFLSGLFKSAKHAADEASEEVKEIADETKKEVTEGKDKVVAEAKDTKDKIAATVKDTKDTVSGKVSEAGQKISDTGKAVGEKVVDGAKRLEEKVDSAAHDVVDSAKAAKDKTVVKATDAKDTVVTAAKDTKDKVKEKVSEGAQKVADTGKAVTEKVVEGVKVAEAKTKETAQEVADSAKTAKDKVAKEIKEDTEAAKQKISSGVDTVVDGTAAAKDKAAKEAKKAKEKTGGFLSGLFKSAKHAAEEVSDDVKEFVDDTKKEAAEEETRARETAAAKLKDVEAAKDKAVAEAKDAKDKVVAAAKDTKDKISEKTSENIQKVSDTGKAVGEKVLDTAEKAKDKTEATAREVADSVKSAKDKAAKEIKDDAEAVKQKVSAGAATVADSAAAAKDKAEKEAKKAKEKTGGFLTGLFKGAKHAADDVSDEVKDFLDETKKEAAEEEARAREAAAAKLKDVEAAKDKAVAEAKDAKDKVTTAVKDTKDAVSGKVSEAAQKVSDAGKTVGEKVADGAKKIEEKADAAAHDVADSVKTAKDKAAEKAKDAKDSVVTAAKDTKDKISEKVVEGAQKVSDTGKAVTDKVAEGVKGAETKTKEVAHDIADTAKSAKDKVAKEIKEDAEAVKHKVESGIDTVTDSAAAAKDKAAKEAKKAKEKTGGFFSGLLKSAKHAADEVSEDVKDFVDETKKEAAEEESRIRESLSEKAKDIEAAKDKASADIKDKTDKVKATAKDVKDSVTDKVSQVTQKASDAGKIVSDKVVDGVKGVEAKTESAARDLAEGAKAAKDKVVADVKGVKDSVTSGTKDAKEAVSEKISDSVQKISDTEKAISTKITEGVKGTSAKVESVAKDVADGAKSAKDKISEDLKHDADVVKDTVSSGIHAVADGAAAAKDKAAKETKKAKEKTGGFLSGLIKGVKHTADDVSDDVKEFLDETKKEAAEEQARAREAISEKAKEIDATKQKAIDDVEAAKDRTAAGMKDAKDKISGKITSTVQSVSDAGKSVGEKVVNGAKTAEAKTEAAVKEVVKDAKATKMKVAKDTKDVGGKVATAAKDTKDKITEKLSGTAHAISDAGKTVGTKIAEGAKKTEAKVETAAKDVADGAKSAKDKVATEVEEDAAAAKQKIVDGTKSVKDKVAKEGKKAKEKGGGFLSGLIKSAKHAAEEVSEDVKEFVDETKKEAVEEEARVREAVSEKLKDVDVAADEVAADAKKAKDKVKSDVKGVKDKVSGGVTQVEKKLDSAAKDTAMALKSAKDKAVADASDAKDKIATTMKDTEHKVTEKVTEGVQRISGTGKAVDQKVSDSMKQTKEFIGSVPQGVVTVTHKVVDSGKSPGDKLQSPIVSSDSRSAMTAFLDEMRRDARWDKAYQEQPDEHTYENVDSSMFVREKSKPESKGISISSPQVTKDVMSTTKTVKTSFTETYEPLISFTDSASPTRSDESKSSKVSRIPQKVSSSFERRSSPSSCSSDDSTSTVRVVNVVKEVEHLEPRIRQTVTTVVTKKSVRTATTPPPSPAEYTDSRIEEDVTEEAARRAQTLADQAHSMAKSESDFLQLSEPSYMETTTTEEDPETHERITRTVQVITSTSGTAGGSDELRESMQKIVDRFMTEERRDQ